MKKILKKYKWQILIILCLSILSMLPLITNTHRLGHDTNFHIANAAIIERNIGMHNFLQTFIINGAANNLGYGINLFYPEFPHIILAYTYHFTKIFDSSILDSLVFLYTVITFISSLFVYTLSNKIFKNKHVALLSSAIFIFFPYRIGDIVVRSALNEVFTFLFIPMILLGLLYLLEHKYKYFYPLFIVGYLGLLNSHLVISLYFTILLIPFFIINNKKIFNKDVLSKLIISTIIVTIFIMPFLINMFTQKILGNYVIFQDGMMTGLNYMEYYSLNINNFFNTNIDFMWDVPVFLNIIAIICFIGSLIFSILKKKTNNNEVFFYLLTFLSFLITLKIFPWEILPKTFYLIQFPWRMETIIAISLSICAVNFLYFFSKKNITIISYITTGLIIITTIPMLISLSTTDYCTIDEVEDNLAMGHSNEYLPVNTNNNLDYYYERTQDIIIKSGDGYVLVTENDLPNLKFNVSKSTDYLVLELPRLYYTGYTLESDSGSIKEMYENKNGFIEVIIDGNATYTLKYKGTVLYNVANVIRIFTLIGLIGYGIVYIIKERQIK